MNTIIIFFSLLIFDLKKWCNSLAQLKNELDIQFRLSSTCYSSAFSFLSVLDLLLLPCEFYSCLFFLPFSTCFAIKFNNNFSKNKQSAIWKKQSYILLKSKNIFNRILFERQKKNYLFIT